MKIEGVFSATCKSVCSSQAKAQSHEKKQFYKFSQDAEMDYDVLKNGSAKFLVIGETSIS
jgi:hypothetical protein